MIWSLVRKIRADYAKLPKRRMTRLGKKTWRPLRGTMTALAEKYEIPMTRLQDIVLHRCWKE